MRYSKDLFLIHVIVHCSLPGLLHSLHSGTEDEGVLWDIAEGKEEILEPHSGVLLLFLLWILGFVFVLV